MWKTIHKWDVVCWWFYFVFKHAFFNFAINIFHQFCAFSHILIINKYVQILFFKPLQKVSPYMSIGFLAYIRFSWLKYFSFLFIYMQSPCLNKCLNHEKKRKKTYFIYQFPFIGMEMLLFNLWIKPIIWFFF